MDDIAIQMALLESLRDSLASIRLAAILCNGCDLYAASPSLVREISEFVYEERILRHQALTNLMKYVMITSVSILYVSGSGNAYEESPGITEQDS